MPVSFLFLASVIILLGISMFGVTAISLEEKGAMAWFVGLIIWTIISAAIFSWVFYSKAKYEDLITNNINIVRIHNKGGSQYVYLNSRVINITKYLGRILPIQDKLGLMERPSEFNGLYGLSPKRTLVIVLPHRHYKIIDVPITYSLMFY